jgi:hypothetical protein
MARVRSKAYRSPTLVLLALDWPEGGKREDFLGFAVSREPGFWGQPRSWLPNRLGFNGPAPPRKDFPSNEAPIQKFLWWDARIDDQDRGKTIRYEIWPIVGDWQNPELLQADRTSLPVKIPRLVEGHIGTCFNRAVVSSQAFSQKFGEKVSQGRLDEALAWLGNGLEAIVPDFLKESPGVEGAIYHLTDRRWVIPALQAYPEGAASFVHNKTTRDDQNAEAVDDLSPGVSFSPRTKAAIMHDKFIVRLKAGRATDVLTGSANFTTGGLTTQANVLHTFASPALASLYLARKRLLDGDPAIAATAKQAGWSEPVKVDEAQIRVFFPPEAKGERESIGAVVKAVKNAKKSVVFCVFTPTDLELRRAIFRAADRGLMMFGLVNSLPKEVADGSPPDAGSQARVELFHRSRRKKDLFAHALFPKQDHPGGFWWEWARLPGDTSEWPVYIHHKFVVIDAETDDPTIYTGSANMSSGALYRNDENLLEIKGSPRLAGIYLAELLRLYEHYRARATWNTERKNVRDTYRLARNSSWARKAFKRGTPEFKSRVNMVGGA